MAARLQDEIRQTRPWASRQEEAALNIARTAAVLDHALARMLKAFDVTPTQYNVLRILRGAGDDGLCRHEVSTRLIRRVPDVTRLLDRLEEQGLIVRRRRDADRRYVTTGITAAGLALLARIDGPMGDFHRTRLASLDEGALTTLIHLLETVRSAG
ncbi:MAG: hypothetical protein ABS36_04255 [Acidobacteria bacterium SCN 69-37]|nr:MAG: hypothetical protein ABS36_04255 [Acidobacteria bacterium SCN 69-37]